MEILIGADNKILKEKAQPILKINHSIRTLAKEMIALMRQNNGVGLAAPQVGQPWRLIVCQLKEKGKPQVFINPEIIFRSSEKEKTQEGCLSLPGIWLEIERPKTIILKAKKLCGFPIKRKYSDLASRIIQHEVDHLDGILITDRFNKDN